MQELTRTAKLCLGREQENPSLWKRVPPHRDGQTGESNYKNTPFLHTPGPGLSAESQVHRERKGNSRTFSYPEKNPGHFLLLRRGEGVGSSVSHPGSHEGYSSLTEQAQKETPAPSQTPTSHLRAGHERWRGEPGPMDVTGLQSQRASPAAPVPWPQLAVGADTDTTDRHAHTAPGPSPCTDAR